jgi:hypothetical protein
MAQRRRHHGVPSLQSHDRIHRHSPVRTYPSFLLPLQTRFPSPNRLPLRVANVPLLSLTTALLTLLDLRTHHLTTASGVYNPMLDIKHPIERSASPFTNTPNPAEHYDADISSQRTVPYSAELHGSAGIAPEDDEFMGSRSQFSRENSDSHGPYKVQKPIEVGAFGYQAPSEQTRYDGPGGAHYF